MTVNLLLEILFGKGCSLAGKFQDSTAFSTNKQQLIEDFGKILSDKGLDNMGRETLHNGMTGEPIDAKIFMGPAYYQRLKHMVSDKIHCLDEHHEVLTLHDGWKNIKYIDMNDDVATLDNGVLKYVKPLNIFHYPNYTGKIYHLSTSHIDLVSTSNHRMWVSQHHENSNFWKPFTFETAEQINSQPRRYKADAIWNIKDYTFTIDMKSFLTLIGLWYNNGWIFGDSRSGIVYIRNTQDVVIRETTLACLDSLKMKYKHFLGDEKIYIYNTDFYKFIHEISIGGEYSKKFPQWIITQLSPTQSRHLINGLILGKKYPYFHTYSNTLANQVHQIAFHAGWSCIHKPTEKYHKLYIEKNILYPQSHTNTNHEYFSHETIDVYCLEVPTGIFYTRRNGKAVWTGNSRATGNVTTLYHQPSSGRSAAGGLRLGEMERDAQVAHGCSRFLKERLFDMSDPFTIPVCNKCGTISNNRDECPKCHEEVMDTNFPYAAKQLCFQLEAMGIKMQFKSKK